MKAKDICLIALLSASLTAGKMVLAAIPNVEIITLLMIVYTLSFGYKRTLLSVLVFVTVEMMIWGLAIWVVLYYVYYPLLVTLVALVKNLKFKIIYACVIGILMTCFFGILSTFLETIISTTNQSFFKFFVMRYLYGLPLILTHIICNSIVLPTAVYPLTKLMTRLSKTIVDSKHIA